MGKKILLFFVLGAAKYEHWTVIDYAKITFYTIQHERNLFDFLFCSLLANNPFGQECRVACADVLRQSQTSNTHNNNHEQPVVESRFVYELYGNR